MLWYSHAKYLFFILSKCQKISEWQSLQFGIFTLHCAMMPWKNMKSTVKSVARISLQKLFFEHQIDWLETSHACIDLLLIRPNIIIGKMLDIPRCQIHQQKTFTDYNAITTEGLTG